MTKLAGGWIASTAMTSIAATKQTTTAAANDLTDPFGHNVS
jgi:hypothetical protein